MKQTAVEFLVEEFKEKLIGDNLPDWVVNIIQQAKAMEMEQIIDAYNDVWLYNNQGKYNPEQYYNETFKSE